MARVGDQKVARPRLSLCLFVFALSLLAACANPADNPSGILEIRIKDHREAIGDFAKLEASIESIAISRKPGLRFWRIGWQEFAPDADTIDLTRYTGGKSASIVRARVGAAAFDAIHLKLRRVEGVLKKDRAVIEVENLIAPVKLSFEVLAHGETIIVLDLVVMDLSDHPPRGYELSVRGYEVYTNGKLVDKIPPGP